MIQPAKDWNSCDTANLLRPPEIGSIVVQLAMGSDFVVLRNVDLQNIAQVLRRARRGGRVIRDVSIR